MFYVDGKTGNYGSLEDIVAVDLEGLLSDSGPSAVADIVSVDTLSEEFHGLSTSSRVDFAKKYGTGVKPERG